MKVLILIILVLFGIIIYLTSKLEKLKIKIIYLSKQNYNLKKEMSYYNRDTKMLNNFKNQDIKLIPINTQNVYIKNISLLKVAPFDYAPKVIDIPKNSNVDIICKTHISGICWYEVSFTSVDLNWYKGWVKDSGIDFIYKA